jgi:hypothetical protein
MLNRQEDNPIYIKVRNIVADNLHIQQDSVHGEFQFNKFIENLASYRIQKLVIIICFTTWKA